MCSIAFIYIYLVQSSFKFTLSHTESLIETYTPENYHSNHESVYVPEQKETEIPGLFFELFTTESRDIREKTTSALSALDSDYFVTTEEPGELINLTALTDTMTDQPKIKPLVEAAAMTNEPPQLNHDVVILPIQTFDKSLEKNPFIDFTSTEKAERRFRNKNQNTVKIFTSIMSARKKGDSKPTTHIEPFSTFLNKLLIFLRVKRSSELRNLLVPFVNYVQELSIAGNLDALGPETITYILDVVQSINDSTIYVLRNKFSELQLKLANRRKDIDDLLVNMDDLYKVEEEEDMQNVINEVIAYPGGKAAARRIARSFVNKVFLKPMLRIARTTKGKDLFSWIKNIVRSRTSHNNTKNIRRQKNVMMKRIASAKYGEHKNDDNSYSNNDHNRIVKNMERIEDMLQDETSNDEEEDLQNTENERSDPSDISEENYGYKPTSSSEDNDEFNKQVTPWHKKEKSGKSSLKMGSDLGNNTESELPQAVRVRLASYDPKTKQNTNGKRIKHKININDNMEQDQKRYKVTKPNITSQEEYFDIKVNSPEDTENSTLLSSKETEKSEEIQVNTDEHQQTTPENELETHHDKLPENINDESEIAPIINTKPVNTMTSKFFAKMEQDIHNSNGHPEELNQANILKIKNMNFNIQYTNTSDVKYKDAVRINKMNTNVNNKIKMLPKGKELREHLEDNGSLNYTLDDSKDIIRLAEHSSRDSELNSTSSEHQSRSDFEVMDTTSKKAKPQRKFTFSWRFMMTMR